MRLIIDTEKKTIELIEPAPAETVIAHLQGIRLLYGIENWLVLVPVPSAITKNNEE